MQILSGAESSARYLTPLILLTFSVMWASAPLLAIATFDTPMPEWPLSDYRIVSGFVWPTVIATFHLGCTIVHFYRAQIPGLPFVAYTSLLALLACLSVYYFLAHGFAVSTNPLPYILALNLAPLVLITNWAWRSRKVGKSA